MLKGYRNINVASHYFTYRGGWIDETEREQRNLIEYLQKDIHQMIKKKLVQKWEFMKI